MKYIKDQLFSTSYQKILKHLATHPSGEHTEKEIQEAVSVSRASANNALRALVNDGLIEVEKKGKTAFYLVDLGNHIIRQTKVLISLIEINPLAQEIKGVCEKIILFGSSSSGTNIEESDIDLFILTNRQDKVRKAINKSRIAEKIQAVVMKPIDYLPLKKKIQYFMRKFPEAY